MGNFRIKILLTSVSIALTAGIIAYWMSSLKIAPEQTTSAQAPRLSSRNDTTRIVETVPNSAGLSTNNRNGVDTSPPISAETQYALQPTTPPPQSNGSDRAPSTITQDSNDSEVPRLSPHVFDVITEVQIRQQAGQWEEALNEMNSLYSHFEALNNFEQTTLLNFYTNTLIQMEMWQESISAFSLMLTIPDLRPDINARALLALGQIHTRLGEQNDAIQYFESWLNFTADMENTAEQRDRVQQMLTVARESVAK